MAYIVLSYFALIFNKIDEQNLLGEGSKNILFGSLGISKSFLEKTLEIPLAMRHNYFKRPRGSFVDF